MTQYSGQFFRVAIVKVVAQRSAVDEFHRDKIEAILLADLIDVSNMRVAKRRRGFSFANEPLHSIAIRGNVRRQNLQGNFAIEYCVLGQIDSADPTRADFRSAFVVADA